MNKILLTGLTVMMTVIVNAQSIEEQATKAGNDAFANAMIRNVLIIAGVAVVYFLFKSSDINTLILFQFILLYLSVKSFWAYT